MAIPLFVAALVLLVVVRLVRRTLKRFSVLSNLDREGIHYWLGVLQETRTQGAYVIFEDMRRSVDLIRFSGQVS